MGLFCSAEIYHVHCNSADSRPKLVAGSAEGYSGHVDGKLREARMNQPKGITVDDRGNIYVADTMNMAIRKISDSGRSISHPPLPLRNYSFNCLWITCPNGYLLLDILDYLQILCVHTLVMLS